MGVVLDTVGKLIAGYLQKEVPGYEPFTPSDPEHLRGIIEQGDVLLVEGNNRVSGIIKYLTQSTWSHAALYVGREAGLADPHHCFVEADLVEGVRGVGFDEYARLHTRICRPVGLSADECERLVRFAVAQIGRRYDLKNVVDLVRYLLPTPPVPVRFRRRMIGLGSGDPARAICLTLLAEAFQTIRYPILPSLEGGRVDDRNLRNTFEEQWRVRHHSLFTPRDFDVSPYFQIVKPTLERGFDFHTFKWIAKHADPSNRPAKIRRGHDPAPQKKL